MFIMQPRAGIEPAQTERVLYQEIEKLKSSEVPEGELRKGKNQLLTEVYREIKTIGGRANMLGNFEIYQGDYKKLFEVEQMLETATAADVRRVAREYFRETNRTVATLVPEVKQ
jgi:zinc protease